MEPTKLLVMVKNALPQLANAFGKTLSILRAVTLKHVVTQKSYFEHKERIGQWILCTKSQTMKKEDHFYVLLLFCFYMMLFIVNNGNILTDGRNERKYFHRKYNEL